MSSQDFPATSASSEPKTDHVLPVEKDLATNLSLPVPETTGPHQNPAGSVFEADTTGPHQGEQ